MKEQLYPLKFYPILKSHLWGGEDLKKKASKITSKELLQKPIGESWEIADLKGNSSIVRNGILEGITLKELMEKYKTEILGPHFLEEPHEYFPLLLKVLDPQKVLSVQVHPNDATAKKLEKEEEKNIQIKGKEEAWYVLNAKKSGKIYCGLKKGISANDVERALLEGTIESLLNVYHPQKDDIFYIPPGTIHALGSDVQVVEIQQNSDLTYRVFDWNRLDLNGQARELHIEKALQSIDYSSESHYSNAKDSSKKNFLLQGKNFSIKKHSFNLKETHHLKLDNGPALIYQLKGEVTLHYSDSKKELLAESESCLIPYSLQEFSLTSKNTQSETLLFFLGNN